jgi:hypothetical protein
VITVGNQEISLDQMLKPLPFGVGAIEVTVTLGRLASFTTATLLPAGLGDV